MARTTRTEPLASEPELVAAEETRPSRRGRGATSVVLLLLLLVALGLLYRYWGFWQAPEEAAAPPAPAVTVAQPLVRDLVEWEEFTGQFEAKDAVEIRARVSGYLESINFTDGQLVKKGDLLFVIEPRPFELEAEAAEARLAQAKAELQLAQSQLNRTAQLREKDFAAQATLEERQAEVATADASVQSADAALSQAKLNLDYTRVIAPISGRVSRREVSVGNLVIGGSSGGTTLLTDIVTLDPIRLVVNVSETDGIAYKRLVEQGELPSARDGKVKVEAQLMDQQAWDLEGTIDFVDNQYDSSTGTIRVRAVFANPEMFITPGQFGRVRVPMSKLKPTMLVPDAAVATDQSNRLLMTVNAENVVVPKVVELGPVVGDNLRVIRSGVTREDWVIVNGLMRARPGAKVTPEKSQIDPKTAPQTAAK